MLEFFLLALAWAMILGIWGLPALIVAIILKIVAGRVDGKDGFQATVIVEVVTVVFGIIAVNERWHEVGYTVVAVLIAVFLIVLGLLEHRQ